MRACLLESEGGQHPEEVSGRDARSFAERYLKVKLYPYILPPDSLLLLPSKALTIPHCFLRITL